MAALDRLVERGVLDLEQAAAVLAELAGPPRPVGPRRLVGEIAGYLGASFVVGATLLFLGEQWDVLGRAGRFAILAAMAAILFGSGLAVRLSAAPPGRYWWRPWRGDSVRRRLASTLLTGAAAASAFAAYAILERDTPQVSPSVAPFVASLVGLTAVAVGYVLARSALGQIGAAVAAFSAYVALLELARAEDLVPLGLGTLALGVLWALLEWRQLVDEGRCAMAIAVTLALGGAQLVVIDGPFLGYALTASVAAVCFAAYARLREWVILAGGVIGVTLVVPELLYDVTDGSLGASGVMLVAGVTLLAGSLAGLRIRRNLDPSAAAS